MNRTQWLDEVVAQTGKTKKEAGFTKRDVDRILSAALDAIVNALAEGEKVTLIGFGTFETRVRAPRKGKSPTGAYSLPMRTVPVFRAGKVLKDAVK